MPQKLLLLLSLCVGLMVLPALAWADDDDHPETQPVRPAMPTIKQVAGLDPTTRMQLFRWLRMLREGDIPQRKAAVLGLMRIKKAERLVKITLIRALHDMNPDVRFLAGYAVSRWGAAIVPLLRTALGSSRKTVRWAAAFALAQIKSPNAVVQSAQIALLRDRFFRVRFEALRGLSKQKLFSKRLKHATVQLLLHDKHFVVRLIANRILKQRVGLPALPVWLKVMRTDRHAVVRREALRAAVQWSQNKALIRQKIKQLLLRETNGDVRSAALGALAKLQRSAPTTQQTATPPRRSAPTLRRGAPTSRPRK